MLSCAYLLPFVLFLLHVEPVERLIFDFIVCWQEHIINCSDIMGMFGGVFRELHRNFQIGAIRCKRCIDIQLLL